MNQITIDKNILLVEVPESASDPWVINNGQESVGLNWYEPNKSFGEDRLTYSTGVKLPAGNWQFIGTTDAITEEIAAKIVAEKDWLGGFGWMYKNYMDDVVKVHERKGPFKSVLLSFASLLRKHKIPTDKRFAILKLNP